MSSRDRRRSKKRDNDRKRTHRAEIVWPLGGDMIAEAWSYAKELHVYVKPISDGRPLFQARVWITRADRESAAKRRDSVGHE